MSVTKTVGSSRASSGTPDERSMSIQTCLTDSFKLEQLSDGLHRADHVYKFALYTARANLGPSTKGYTPAGEVQGSGYTAGGAELRGRIAELRDGVACVDFEPPAWDLSTIRGARG